MQNRATFDHQRADDRPAAPAVDWDGLYRRYGATITRTVRVALRRLGRRPQRELVEELTQETYCRLLESRAAAERLSGPGRDGDDAGAYLRECARNVVIDWLRRRVAEKRGAGRELQLPAPERADPAPDPEQRLLRREREASLRARLAAVVPGRHPHRAARMLELAVFDDLTGEEIAERLDPELSSTAVHSALYRIRRGIAARGRGFVIGERAAPSPLTREAGIPYHSRALTAGG